jgi:hypothetical protein
MGEGMSLPVWIRNLAHWKTRLAVRWLSRALQRDDSFAEVWHANIAMALYDSGSVGRADRGYAADAVMSRCFGVSGTARAVREARRKGKA